jgi:hypothetical protein
LVAEKAIVVNEHNVMLRTYWGVKRLFMPTEFFVLLPSFNLKQSFIQIKKVPRIPSEFLPKCSDAESKVPGRAGTNAPRKCRTIHRRESVH